MKCHICGKEHNKRIDLTQVDKEELDSIKLIMNKRSCTDQAFQCITQFPSNASQETVDKFVNTIIKNKAEVQFLEDDWWSIIATKYDFFGEVYIDFSDGMLYRYEE
jgi:hypothetical protein